MRRRIHDFTLSWTHHRLILGPYKRANGGFHDEFHLHEALPDSKARLPLFFEGINHIESLTSHCTSAFEAMPNLLVGHSLPWPFLAMSRVSLESAARICYTLDPRIDADQRLMRLSALVVWSEGEASKALAGTSRLSVETMAEQRARLELRSSLIGGDITAAGLLLDTQSRHPVVRDPRGVRPPEPSNLALVDVIEKQFPGLGNEYYRRTSGFVHGAPWVLSGSMTEISNSSFSVPNVTKLQVADSFLLTIVAVTNAMKLSASYSGIPFGKLDRKADQLMAVTQREAARLSGPARSYGLFGGPRH